MKILLYHPVRLPPRDYGGVERVVLWLSEGLRDFGHDVSVAALPGSRLPEGVRLLTARTDEPVERLVEKESFDLVHFHSPPASDRKIPFPHLITIHGNGKPGEKFHPSTVFLSRDHANRHGRSAWVYNGVNPREFIFRPQKSGGARPLFLSKTSWKVKNLPAAMEFAKKAGTGLSIAGGYRPFKLLLKSWAMGFDWLGPVAGEFKARSLADASCLLFPVRWAEPFGLVMVESMISGTPVIASRVGSVPEVISEHGGLALDLEDEQAWIDAMQGVLRFDPTSVRRAALERFTHWKMAESYLQYYQKAIRGERFS